MGIRKVEIDHEIADYDMDTESNFLYVGDLIYVNAKGDVLLCCDLSYNRQRYHAIGNILKESFENILIRNLCEKNQKASA